VASQAAFAAQQVLQNAGVTPDAMVMSAYNATGQAAPTVSVGFVRLTASVPNCSTYTSDMTKTGSNEPYRSYGCAVTANFASQIADPGDLLAPKPQGAPDTARRAFVLDTYRQGKPTGTPRSGNPAESSDASNR
jgi:pilus assembly protein CpaD